MREALPIGVVSLSDCRHRCLDFVTEPAFAPVLRPSTHFSANGVLAQSIEHRESDSQTVRETVRQTVSQSVSQTVNQSDSQ